MVAAARLAEMGDSAEDFAALADAVTAAGALATEVVKVDRPSLSPTSFSELEPVGNQTDDLFNAIEALSQLNYPETAPVCRDCMVVDAVLKNQSAEAEFCRKCPFAVNVFLRGPNGAFRSDRTPVFTMR